jgi:hypothetical protein
MRKIRCLQGYFEGWPSTWIHRTRDENKFAKRAFHENALKESIEGQATFRYGLSTRNFSLCLTSAECVSAEEP